VKMLEACRTATHKPTPYATSADFCRIFREDMNRLYLLSLLLTGDQVKAESCFVLGLEDVGKGNPVFREWAQSWARRTIIQKAIEMIQPRPTDGSTSEAAEAGHAPAELSEMVAVVELPVFERFAFVMSVLERISDQECSLLLDCSRSEVSTARRRAFQRIGRSAELQRTSSAGPLKQLPRNGSGSSLHLEPVSPLAATA
jgi:hypothetical protein